MGIRKAQNFEGRNYIKGESIYQRHWKGDNE